MAHSPDKKIKLRAAYVGGLPLEAAADKVGVPLPTARTWYRDARAAGDDWDAFQKASLIVSGGGIEQALGRIIAAALLRCEQMLETPSEDIDGSIKAMATIGDTIAKLRAASKGMMPETDRLGVAMELLRDLSDFIRTNHPRHMQAFAEILEGFGARIAKPKG